MFTAFHEIILSLIMSVFFAPFSNAKPTKDNRLPFKIYFYIIYFIFFPVIILLTVVLTIIFFIINLPNFKENRRIGKIYKYILSQYKHKKFFIIFTGKRDSFYKNHIIDYLRNDISILWVNRKKLKSGDYDNDKLVKDIISILSTSIKNFNYPVYISIKKDYFIHYNIKDDLFKYEKGKISVEELIHSVNNFDNIYEYHKNIWEKKAKSYGL